MDKNQPQVPPEAWKPIYLAAIQDLIAFRARCQQIEGKLAHWIDQNNGPIQTEYGDTRYSAYREGKQVRIMRQEIDPINPPPKVTVALVVPASQWGRIFLNNTICWLAQMGGEASPISQLNDGKWHTKLTLPKPLLHLLQNTVPEGVLLQLNNDQGVENANPDE